MFGREQKKQLILPFCVSVANKLSNDVNGEMMHDDGTESGRKGKKSQRWRCQTLVFFSAVDEPGLIKENVY